MTDSSVRSYVMVVDKTWNLKLWKRFSLIGSLVNRNPVEYRTVSPLVVCLAEY